MPSIPACLAGYKDLLITGATICGALWLFALGFVQLPQHLTEDVREHSTRVWRLSNAVSVSTIFLMGMFIALLGLLPTNATSEISGFIIAFVGFVTLICFATDVASIVAWFRALSRRSERVIRASTVAISALVNLGTFLWFWVHVETVHDCTATAVTMLEALSVGCFFTLLTVIANFVSAEFVARRERS